ncbi:extensin [Hyalella azteca]|uniref:Extensin n=1 Tax=Hyalella azteca TaxID=294128 RepID=A0A8B7P6H0_HYAAZ|nr:extensin [Hyalella azteca]
MPRRKRSGGSKRHVTADKITSQASPELGSPLEETPAQDNPEDVPFNLDPDHPQQIVENIADSPEPPNEGNQIAQGDDLVHALEGPELGAALNEPVETASIDSNEAACGSPSSNRSVHDDSRPASRSDIETMIIEQAFAMEYLDLANDPIPEEDVDHNLDEPSFSGGSVRLRQELELVERVGEYEGMLLPVDEQEDNGDNDDEDVVDDNGDYDDEDVVNENGDYDDEDVVDDDGDYDDEDNVDDNRDDDDEDVVADNDEYVDDYDYDEDDDVDIEMMNLEGASTLPPEEPGTSNSSNVPAEETASAQSSRSSRRRERKGTLVCERCGDRFPARLLPKLQEGLAAVDTPVIITQAPRSPTAPVAPDTQSTSGISTGTRNSDEDSGTSSSRASTPAVCPHCQSIEPPRSASDTSLPSAGSFSAAMEETIAPNVTIDRQYGHNLPGYDTERVPSAPPPVYPPLASPQRRPASSGPYHYHYSPDSRPESSCVIIPPPLSPRDGQRSSSSHPRRTTPDSRAGSSGSAAYGQLPGVQENVTGPSDSPVHPHSSPEGRRNTRGERFHSHGSSGTPPSPTIETRSPYTPPPGGPSFPYNLIPQESVIPPPMGQHPISPQSASMLSYAGLPALALRMGIHSPESRHLSPPLDGQRISPQSSSSMPPYVGLPAQRMSSQSPESRHLSPPLDGQHRISPQSSSMIPYAGLPAHSPRISTQSPESRHLSPPLDGQHRSSPQSSSMLPYAVLHAQRTSSQSPDSRHLSSPTLSTSSRTVSGEAGSPMRQRPVTSPSRVAPYGASPRRALRRLQLDEETENEGEEETQDAVVPSGTDI